MNYQDIKEFYNDIKTDKTMLYIFRIAAGTIAFSLLAAVVIFIHHAVKDKPAKLFFGLAEINTLKTDTVYKLVQTPKDTVYKETIKYVSGFKKEVKSATKLDTSSKNSIYSSGANAHNIAGTGNKVDVNGDQYLGIKQRHLDSQV
jgi:hypothetical protein